MTHIRGYNHKHFDDPIHAIVDKVISENEAVPFKEVKQKPKRNLQIGRYEKACKKVKEITTKLKH